MFRGRRTFIAGVVVLFLFAALHTLAAAKSALGPLNPDEANLMQVAQGIGVPMGPLHPTAWSLIKLLSVSYSILLLYVGVLDLVALKAAPGRLRGISAANVVFTGLLAVASAVAQFPPPLVCSVAACLLFGISWVRQGGAAPPAAAH